MKIKKTTDLNQIQSDSKIIIIIISIIIYTAFFSTDTRTTSSRPITSTASVLILEYLLIQSTNMSI